VSAGINHTCGVRTNGTVACWGRNDYGQASPPVAVGGIAELPALAGTGGSGMGGTTYAVLAGAAAGVLAFAVLATLSVKGRSVR
jgi:hypothetical protein